MAKRYSIPAAFNPSTGAVDCSNIVNFIPALVLAIIDTSVEARPNGVIYDPVTAGRGISIITGTTLFVEVDTSGLSADDPLLVIWEDGTADSGGGGGGALSTSFDHDTISLTGARTALPNVVATNGVLLIADQDNQGIARIFKSSVTTNAGYPLTAGLSVALSVNNANLIYVTGSIGDKINWLVT